MNIDFHRILSRSLSANSELEKYGFSLYDTVVALMVTGYLKTVDSKVVLRGIVDPRILEVNFQDKTITPAFTKLNGPALAKLLDQAAAWCQAEMQNGTVSRDDQLMRDLIDTITENVLTEFNGVRYVGIMPAGFAAYMTDLYLTK